MITEIKWHEIFNVNFDRRRWHFSTVVKQTRAPTKWLIFVIWRAEFTQNIFGFYLIHFRSKSSTFFLSFEIKVFEIVFSDSVIKIAFYLQKTKYGDLKSKRHEKIEFFSNAILYFWEKKFFYGKLLKKGYSNCTYKSTNFRKVNMAA